MKQKRDWSLFIIVLLWAIMNGILLYKNGIVTDGEAEKYITQAKYFLSTGQFQTNNFWLYSTQIFLLVAAIKFNLGFLFVVIVHWLVNLAATYSLYMFGRKLFNKPAALAVTIIFLLNYPLQEFNTFLQTESLFYSLTLIFSLTLLQLQRLTFLNFLAIAGGLALICITRPTGILFAPCVFLYLFFRFFTGIRTGWKLGIVAGVTVIFLYIVNLALGSGGELDFMLPYRDERVICGVPTLRHFIDIDTAENSNSIYGMLYYISHNFGQFMSLAWRRTIAFFGMLRTYYSTGHNIFLALFFYPAYIFMLFSSRYWIKKQRYLFLYLTSCIVMNWGTVALTCDDWHNRFYLTIWPYLIILALPAVNNLFAKFAPHDSNTAV